MGAGYRAPAGGHGGRLARSRIEAVNLLTAATSWRSPVQRFGFWLLGRTDWQARHLGQRQSVLLNLKDLNHLHYGSWVDIGTFPDVPSDDDYPTESGRRYWNVFNGNFNLGWEPYMESFLDNTAGGVHLAWGDTIGYSGYPRHGSLKETLRWQDERRIPNLHYYVAYPGATTNDVRAAVRVRRELLSFVATKQGMLRPVDAGDLERLHRRLQHCLTGLRAEPVRADATPGPRRARGTDGFTAFFPVKPNEVPDVVKLVKEWEDWSPFASLAGTHFGRIALIPKGTTADQGDDVPIRNTWLQLSVVADICASTHATTPRIATEDLQRYAEYVESSDELRDVLGHCFSKKDLDFIKWFERGVCDRYLTYRDYPDVTLREIQEGFRLVDLLTRSVGDDATRAELLAACRALLASPDQEPQPAEGG